MNVRAKVDAALAKVPNCARFEVQSTVDTGLLTTGEPPPLEQYLLTDYGIELARAYPEGVPPQVQAAWEALKEAIAGATLRQQIQASGGDAGTRAYLEALLDLHEALIEAYPDKYWPADLFGWVREHHKDFRGLRAELIGRAHMTGPAAVARIAKLVSALDVLETQIKDW